MEYSTDELGPRLRALRMAKGISLSAFAGRVFYTKGYLSKVETGLQTPSPAFIRRCDAELGANGELIALGEERVRAPEATPSGGGEEIWIMTMTPGGSSFTPVGRRDLVGAALLLGTSRSRWLAEVADPGDQVRRLRVVFDSIREIGQTVAPSAILPMLIGQAHVLRELSRQLTGRMTDELAVLAARTAEFAGWMAQEDGDDQTALWWTDRAVEVAGDDGMTAASYAFVRRAHITLHQGDTAATIALARRAQARASTPARIRGLAAQREAQGHAAAGDYDACMRALDRAGTLLRERDDRPDGPVIGTSHVTDPVAMVTGWCLHDLGRPREAAEILDRQIAHIPESAVRARTRFGARRALAYAASGELEHACFLAREIIENLAHIQSATILADVRRLAATLRRWPTNEHVRAIAPALTAALSLGR